MAYEVVSEIYDGLMEDVDYLKWCNFMETLFLEKTPDIHHILELGCGSGIMTRHLLEKGYEVVGTDCSEEMLLLAQEKLQKFGKNIILMEQDIRDLDFEIYEIDCILSSNDTFNYILEENELRKLFAYLNKRLKAGGSFVFDISSEYKLSQILGNNVFGESFEDMAYLWENDYEPETKLLDMKITLFEQEGNLYTRHEEKQTQRAYRSEQIITLLQESGYVNIEVYGDFDRTITDLEHCERWFFVPQKRDGKNEFNEK